jgi:hypothetical protein
VSFLGKDNSVAARRDIGFALAVLAPALLVALAFVLSFGFDDADLAWRANVFLLAFFVAAMIIALAALLIGLPLTWLLEQWRIETPWSYPLAGFIAGAAVIVVAPALFGEAPFEFLPYAWIGALPGAVSGAIWWRAYRRHARDPGDRDGRE